MPTRTASATWEGTLRKGKGRFSGESGAINAEYNFGSRFENAGRLIGELDAIFATKPLDESLRLLA